MADEWCVICGGSLTWEHDHQPDSSGLDDGPPLDAARKRPAPKSSEEVHAIRARAWATRREKYGRRGHV